MPCVRKSIVVATASLKVMSVFTITVTRLPDPLCARGFFSVTEPQETGTDCPENCSCNSCLRTDFVAFGLQRMRDCLQERTGEGNDFDARPLYRCSKKKKPRGHPGLFRSSVSLRGSHSPSRALVSRTRRNRRRRATRTYS